MQPGVTVVLATLWLAVYANVGVTTSHKPYHLIPDQYSPLDPQQQHYGIYRRDEAKLYRKDQNLQRWISIGTFGLSEQPSRRKRLEQERLLVQSKNNAKDDFLPIIRDKQSHDLPLPTELEDSFAADDTFQDQGPSSVEIYKLDFLGEKALLNPASITKFQQSKTKSKAPKKSSYLNWKTKAITEYKATSPKTFYKQSNSFGNSSTEIMPITDPFSIGGVPELQVGCEGSEASDHAKQKRSISPPIRDNNAKKAEPWMEVSPISLDLDYDIPGESSYEEMDELVKLKQLETTTKGDKQKRGDMEATMHLEFFDESKRNAEKLPVRGDLGKSSMNNNSSTMSNESNEKVGKKDAKEILHLDKVKRDVNDKLKYINPQPRKINQSRKLLWFHNSDDFKEPEKDRRTKRGLWGFGEDEGAVSSDELQTAYQRRSQEYEKRLRERERQQQQRQLEEAQRRSNTENRTNSNIEKIREDYERSLKQKQKEEEERLLRLQQSHRRQVEENERRRSLQDEELRRNRWLAEEHRRHDLESRRTSHDMRQYSASTSTDYENDRRRQKQQEIANEQRKENRLREEEEQRWRSLVLDERNRRQQQGQDRRSFEEKQREWALKRRQDEEDERKRQLQNMNEPSNLLYSIRNTSNESRSAYDTRVERRMREHEERERQRKLSEYIQRNRPINMKSLMDRESEEQINRRRLHEERRKLEEEGKSLRSNWQEYRSGVNQASPYNRSSYPGSGNDRRNYGPSASMNIDRRNYMTESSGHEAGQRADERQIRERQEQLRREALMREQDARRMQSRRYEEDRRRLEATRLETERRRTELRDAEIRHSQAGGRAKPSYQEREYGRRGDTRLVPAALHLNGSRRATELERQRPKHDRRRLEVQGQRNRNNRVMEANKDEQQRALEEQWRRQEEARLNALPVSARIIVRPAPSISTPNIVSRMGFETDIDFQGVNPNRPGVPVPNFPAPMTPHPPVQSPSPCVWAVVQCCPSTANHLVPCFESMGCPGVNWDPNPCRGSITQAARQQIMQFYAETETNDRRL